MHRIKNVHRFSPFSHRMGIHVWVPFTGWKIEVFPTRIVLQNLINIREKEEITFALTGSIEAFTVIANWEAGRVQWYLRAQEGWITWYLFADSQGLVLELRKGPKTGVKYRCSKDIRSKRLCVREALHIVSSTVFPRCIDRERLTLGVTKKQSIEGIRQRNSLTEILPLCFFVGQLVPKQSGKLNGPIQQLFEQVEKADRNTWGEKFTQFIAVAVYDLFVPSFEDKFHQGILSKGSSCGSVLNILSSMYACIRNCFLREQGSQIFLLPAVPVGSHAGRMTGVTTKLACFDIEWRKQQMRRMTIRGTDTGDFFLSFPDKVKTFRLRETPRDKGTIVSAMNSLTIYPNQTYYLDQFIR